MYSEVVNKFVFIAHWDINMVLNGVKSFFSAWLYWLVLLTLKHSKLWQILLPPVITFMYVVCVKYSYKNSLSELLGEILC